ncbi:MAG: glycosyltransferase, partial [Luteitalea sp.]
MRVPQLAAVLHGAHWPSGDPGAEWRDRLSRVTGREVDVVLARDEPTAPRGFAACLAEALARTMAPQVLVVDVHARPSDQVILALLTATADDDVALARPAPAAATPGPERDQPAPLLDRLVHLAQSADTPTIDDPLAWSARREALIDIGGPDQTLWSFGVVDDLAARLQRLGRAVVEVPVDEIPVTGVSYPFVGAVDQFLRWRNQLRLAVAHTPRERLGPALSEAVLRCLAACWRATGLDAASVRFGGEWGRGSLTRRMRTRLGGAPPADLWPADETGTAVPLAALQAFALELPALVTRRASQDARATQAAHGVVPPPVDADFPAATRVDSGLPVARPSVSVIVVNWNGRDHLEACFSSLLASDQPTDLLELICVDNGSSDDSIALLAARFPSVRVVALAENLGFTGGNQAGVAAATGQVLVFLNNDMRVEPTFVSRLVDALDERTACAAARVMNWDGTRIDFVRGTSSFESRGFQEQYAQPYTAGMALAESFFPNGGAFAVTRRAYDEAGGFDPALFAYYDDIDLGWRLRMMGHAIRTAPDAVAYHRHGATVATQPHAHKRFLMARNALWTAVRNYDDRALPCVLPALLTLAGLRVAQDLVWLRTPVRDALRPWLEPSRGHRVPSSIYRTASKPGSQPEPPVARVIASLAMPELVALGATLQALPRLLALRAHQQQTRRVPDTEVLPFLGRPFEELDGRRSYRAAQQALVDGLGLRALLGLRPHVVLVTHEALRAHMSGPAIRVLELARALGRTVRVSVLAPAPLEVRDDRVALIPFDPARPTVLEAQAETADAVIVQGFALTTYPFLSALVTPIVADLYCPFTLEHLEQTRMSGAQAVPAALEGEAAAILGVQNAQLQQADFFICASERQRDFWVGTLHSAGRVNPRTLARDADLRSLIDVVPFGLPSEPIGIAAARARAARLARGAPAGVLKGVHPSIRATDRVLLWGGSLLDWQDPETLIAAVAQLARVRDDVK